MRLRFLSLAEKFWSTISSPIFLFFAIALGWNLFLLWVYWPGYLTHDGAFYYEYFGLDESVGVSGKFESLLYTLLVMWSVRIWGAFQAVNVLQILFAVGICTSYFAFLNRTARQLFFLHWLVLGSVVFSINSLMLQLAQRDIFFSWAVIWIFTILAQISNETERRSRWAIVLGLAAVIAMEFKQSALVGPFVVLAQLLLLRVGRKVIQTYAVSFLGFFLLISVALPISLKISVATPIQYCLETFDLGLDIAKDQSGRGESLDVREYLKLKVSHYLYAREEPNYVFQDLKAVLEFSQFSEKVFARDPRLWQYPSVGLAGKVHAYLYEHITGTQWGWFWNKILIGEIVILLGLLGFRWLPNSAILCLYPLVQAIIAFLFQPVGKGRYFYFLLLLPYFLLPYLLKEWRSRRNRPEKARK